MTTSRAERQFPDLVRMQPLVEAVRLASDDDLARFLATEDGQWLIVECGPFLAADVARRIATQLVARLPAAVVDYAVTRPDPWSLQ